MKKPKLFLLLFLTLGMTSVNVSAQKSDSSDDLSVYLAGAVPEVDGKVVFSKEFSIPGLKRDVVYERVQKWMEKRLAENNNDRSRIVYSDKENGNMVGAAEEWLTFKSNALALDRAWMGYSVKAECADEICRVSIEKIRYTYQEKEKYTAEEIISDSQALNKAKTKMIIGFKKWRMKTVDFADDMFDAVAKALGTDEEMEAAEKAAAEAAAKAKKSNKVVIGTTAATAATTAETPVVVAQPTKTVAVQAAEETKKETAVAEAPKTTTTTTGELKEIAPAEVSKDAIKVGEGKLVIVIGEGDVFNMSITTANGGGSIGRVDNRPVAFSILSPDQSYDAVERAETYNVKYYPTGETTPALVLECRKVEAPAPFEGQPRTYIGEIVKAYSR
jgi:hypothetical protein